MPPGGRPRKGRARGPRGEGALHAVILAGGAGERFWPASRRHHPKPLLRVEKGDTLLGATAARAGRFADPDCVWMVCGSEHHAALRRAAGLPARRVLVEPARRNTAMAVGLAAQRIFAADPEAVVAVLPADHRIPAAAAFARDIRRAARAVAREEALVTIGVEPRRPDPGLGYIQVGRPVGGAAPGLHRVRRFVEKPDAKTAARYLRAGGYLWNAGIFVWKARTILEEIRLHAPKLHRALAPVRSAKARPTREALRAAYRRAPSLPIDVAVMEKSRRVWTLPVAWHWSDVGTWQSLADELGVRPGRSRVVAGEVAFDDGGGNLVWGGDRTIALLGVEGLAVIDTGDALLVARLDHAARVREVVAQLKAKGRADVT